jgi:hypothetical protein
VSLVDRRSGRPVRPIVVDEATGTPLALGDVRAKLETGALRAPRTRAGA